MMKSRIYRVIAEILKIVAVVFLLWSAASVFTSLRDWWHYKPIDVAWGASFGFFFAAFASLILKSMANAAEMEAEEKQRMSARSK